MNLFSVLEVAIGEYGPIVNKLIFKPSEEMSEFQIEDKDMKNSKFQIKNLKISDIKNCIKNQSFKDDSLAMNTHAKGKGERLKSQISQMWPTNFIFQFYCLYSTNIILFQKAYVSVKTKFTRNNILKWINLGVNLNVPLVHKLSLELKLKN